MMVLCLLLAAPAIAGYILLVVGAQRWRDRCKSKGHDSVLARTLRYSAARVTKPPQLKISL